jgi:phage repressor protein C with HTH and peptisase S24 domain
VRLIARDGAYIIEVFGDTMEPRYFAGEVVYVDPRRSVGDGDFVVAQIHEQGKDLPRTRIKRFASYDDDWLKLAQYNPQQTLTFPSSSVVSLHPIVYGGKRQHLG